MAEGATAGTADSDAVVGTVVSASAGGLTVRTPDETVRVVSTAGARMYSGASGTVTELTSFLPGDRIAVEGSRQGGTLRATSIGSVYKRVDAQVRSVSTDGSLAQTSVGTIQLTKGRLPFTPKELQLAGRREVRRGDVISGLGWRHPRTGETYLMVHAR